MHKNNKKYSYFKRYSGQRTWVATKFSHEIWIRNHTFLDVIQFAKKRKKSCNVINIIICCLKMFDLTDILTEQPTVNQSKSYLAIIYDDI